MSTGKYSFFIISYKINTKKSGFPTGSAAFHLFRTSSYASAFPSLKLSSESRSSPPERSGFNSAPRLPSGILATFPSYYQMLPGASGGTVAFELSGGAGLAAYDLFNPNAWLQNKWGLGDPANDRYWKLVIPDAESKTPEERRLIARDHLIKCLVRAWQFRRALSVPSAPPENCLLYLFAGDAVDTAAVIRVGADGRLLETEYSAGDGKVLVSSARFDSKTREIKMPPFSRSPIEWRAVYHIGAAHMGFFASDAFWKNARYNLLMQPTPEQRVRYKLNE